MILVPWHGILILIVLSIKIQMIVNSRFLLHCRYFEDIYIALSLLQCISSSLSTEI